MFIIITASPNPDGLTAAAGQAAASGISEAGGLSEVIDISAARLAPCRICGNGWGTCRSRSKCVIDDILGELQPKVRQCEGLILVTPVYFGQPSERMRYFLDRFRRSEAFNPDGSAAAGKQVDLIAAAGGSGNGTASCLTEMEAWCRSVQAIARERIGVTRFNRTAILPAISDATARLVRGEYHSRQ
jgi:multimeric flavodoxin WrbA